MVLWQTVMLLLLVVKAMVVVAEMVMAMASTAPSQNLLRCYLMSK